MPNARAMLDKILSLLTVDELDTLDVRLWAKQAHPTIRGRVQDELNRRGITR